MNTGGVAVAPILLPHSIRQDEHTWGGWHVITLDKIRATISKRLMKIGLGPGKIISGISNTEGRRVIVQRKPVNVPHR